MYVKQSFAFSIAKHFRCVSFRSCYVYYDVSTAEIQFDTSLNFLLGIGRNCVARERNVRVDFAFFRDLLHCCERKCTNPNNFLR